MSAPASIYNQYLTAYKHNAATYGPNTAILMLVGGFYELYDVIDEGEPQTSMKRAVEILGIQLKLKKGDAGGKDGLFAGFPKDSLMKYVALLTRENWTVAVLDQVDAVGKQRKDRALARIYSPGTMEGGNDAVFLGGVWFQEIIGAPPTFAAAAVDLTTGCMTTYSGKATGKQAGWSTDDLVHFFQVHSPKELVVWWDGAAVAMPSDLAIRKATGSNSALIHRRTAKAVSPLQCESLARQAFRLKTMLPITTILKGPMTSPNVQAIVALIGFVQDHYMATVDSIHTPTEWLPESAVFLGNHALTQLNMIAQRPEDSVLGLYMKTATSFGKRAMRERILYPICDPITLELRYKQVEWALTTDLQPVLRQIEDLPRLHHKIHLGTTSAADVLLLDKSYERIQALSAMTKGSPLGDVPDMSLFLQAFHSIFSVEKAQLASEDAFCLQDAVAPAVTAIEEEIAAATAAMSETVDKVIQDLGLTPGSLRLDFKEASVAVTGTKAIMTLATKALKGVTGIQVVSKKASSSLEVPALTSLFHKILALRAKLLTAVKETLPGLCDKLSMFSETWLATEAWVATADITATVARVSEANGFCRPTLIAGSSASVDITGLAHPLIEPQQTQLEYVRHNVRLDRNTGGWLVYGMNASGKSSLMKAVGIATVLAQAGCYVPATAFRFTPFRAIFTRILNKDDLWAGLSSFAVEMTELNEILRRSDCNSLVLGDEVCSGTESDSATALVGAALQWLSSRGAKYIFATHLHGLHGMPIVTAISSLQVWHLRVRRDASDRLIYERTLQPGAGSSLYGLEVAKAMGLPLEFLETAHKLRKELAGTVAQEDAVKSRWNTAITRAACEICGNNVTAALEVHHVQQRSEAVNRRLSDGSSMNSARNLAVLCEACHEAHHAGIIEVGPVQQTSEGPVRSIITNQSPKADDDVVEHIESILRERPNAPLKRLVYDLERQGIKISEQRLRSMRKGLPAPAPEP
jgi:DNA mismatch repair protein MutS